MDLFQSAIGLFICYTVLPVQFYRASKKGYYTIADVAANGSGLAVLNRRHAVSGAAMAAMVLYFGIVKQDWLMLGAPLGTQAALLTAVFGLTTFTLSWVAAIQALRKLKSSGRMVGSFETYVLLRALFIILYEVFFRAVLYNFVVQWTSVPVAIAINVVLYAGAHIFSSRQELIGSVPFGLALCLITVYARSVWPAVLVHLLMALPYDIYIFAAPKFSTKTSIS